MLEKLESLVLRTLFMRMATILGGNKIRIDALLPAFHWLGSDIDGDEVECLLANLIYKGFIKGYISHAHRTMVLSKAQPFPPLAGILRRAAK